MLTKTLNGNDLLRVAIVECVLNSDIEKGEEQSGNVKRER